MEPVIGLDFGTTNSAIAVADDARQAALATFADGPAQQPPVSARYFTFPHETRLHSRKPETQPDRTLSTHISTPTQRAD